MKFSEKITIFRIIKLDLERDICWPIEAEYRLEMLIIGWNTELRVLSIPGSHRSPILPTLAECSGWRRVALRCFATCNNEVRCVTARTFKLYIYNTRGAMRRPS